MMGFSPNLKKVLLVGTILLFSCDVTMLFAAPSNAGAATPATSPQAQQLQAQVQEQIKALQAQSGSAVAPSSGQNPSAPVLPPSPFNSPPPFNPSQAAQTLQQQQNFVPPPLPQGQPQLTNTPTQLPSDLAAVVSQSNGGSQITQEDLNTTAFNSMVQNALPMSPEQIQKLRSLYMASQFAAASSPNTPPRPTATSTFVDLSPGATPPVIRLSQGFITSLVFVDSTGAAWPIESYDIGNPSAFNIQWDKTSNALMIQSTVLYTYGNLAVKLRGLDTPVMITLIPGQKAVDYRVDLRIQGFGPNAKAVAGSTLPESTSSELLNVLDGVPPTNSQNLTVDGGDCQAWISGGKMYVRTRLNVLSPGWSATLSSADGMHAYEMQPAPMLLVSQNGQVVQLKVKGF
jgi:intracellular multiplication protein IcmK